jgi:hypothetical protein
VSSQGKEEKMSKIVTMLIAGLFVAGNAVAQTTAAPAAPAKSPTAATPAAPAAPAATPSTTAKPLTGAPAAETKKADPKSSGTDAKKAAPETGKK